MKYDFIYDELQKQYKALRKMEENLTLEERRKKHQSILDTAQEILELGNITRTSGLLWLEEACNELSKEKQFMKMTGLDVVDGMDPELVLQIATFRYISSEKDPYSAIEKLMIIVGMLGIQQGYNPRTLKNLIVNMAPEDVIDEIEGKGNIKKQPKEQQEEESKIDYEIFCKGEIHFRENDDGYEEIAQCDKIFRRFSSQMIQNVLCITPKDILGEIMIGLSGEARRCIFKNLSRSNIKEVIEFLIKYVGDEEENYKLENQFSRLYIKEAAEKINQIVADVCETVEIALEDALWIS